MTQAQGCLALNGALARDEHAKDFETLVDAGVASKSMKELTSIAGTLASSQPELTE